MRVDASESALKTAAKAIVQTSRTDDGSIPENVVGDAIAEALNIDTVTKHVLAKDRESRNGLSHLQALNAIATGLGYANWNALRTELGASGPKDPETATGQTPRYPTAAEARDWLAGLVQTAFDFDAFQLKVHCGNPEFSENTAAARIVVESEQLPPRFPLEETDTWVWGCIEHLENGVEPPLPEEVVGIRTSITPEPGAKLADILLYRSPDAGRYERFSLRHAVRDLTSDTGIRDLEQALQERHENPLSPNLSRLIRTFVPVFNHLQYAHIGKSSIDNQVFVGLMDLDRLIAIAYGQTEKATPFAIKRAFAPGVEDTLSLNVNPIRRRMPTGTLQPLRDYLAALPGFDPALSTQPQHTYKAHRETLLPLKELLLMPAAFRESTRT